MLKVELIDTIEKLMLLKDPWNDVLRRSNCDAIYLTWEWFFTWWKSFGKDNELFILLVKKGERILAILPFMKTKVNHFGLPSQTIKAISNDYTPYFDIITTEEAEESLELIFKHLKRVKWDIIELGSILSDSQTIKALERLSIKGVIKMHKESAVSKRPYISIESSWNEYYSKLSKQFIYNLKRAEKKLLKIGKVTLEEIRRSDNIDKLLEEGYQIEYSSWKGQTETAICCNNNVKKFYTDFAHIAAERDWLSLFFLKINDTKIAFMYCLRFEGILQASKMGYDPAYSKYSVGNLLIKRIAERLPIDSLNKFNLGGECQSFKRKWTRHAHEFNVIWIYKKGIYQEFLYLTRFGIKSYFKRYSFIVNAKHFLKNAVSR